MHVCRASSCWPGCSHVGSLVHGLYVPGPGLRSVVREEVAWAGCGVSFFEDKGSVVF